ncbi:hypothetical protein [Mycobacterium sp. 155]|uniref:hypothetical protein n=1 Tax=Mycobacterium sp. 155 TaxID=1157943 RepID=UPI0003649346|nr:hypothetical protein [Mycobacterium sp. 155]
MRDGDVNRREGWCRRCRGIIPAGAGVFHKRALVHAEACPEPEEIVRPNRYAGACDLCNGWVAEGEGVAVRQDTSTVTGARYAARHDGYCPANAKPAPVEGGFTAQWTAASVGTKIEPNTVHKGWDPHPWVRELTKGVHGEQRYRWIRGRRDYSGVSPDGSAGITTSFTLRHGHIYEAECVVRTPGRGQIHNARRRMFLQVTADGDVKMLAEGSEEVQTWLAAG